MPKEISHIALAESVRDQLTGGSIFHEPVMTHVNLFLYGAVAPDVPYFYLVGPRIKLIQSLTRQFHTPDESSLVPILDFLRQFPQKDPDALAFAAGLCCHILSDTHFHPMVYYFAGMDGVHKGATARHRLFETAMDLYFRQSLTDDRKKSLWFLFRRLEIPVKRFRYLFHALFNLKNDRLARYLNRSIQFHQMIQALFFSPKIYNIIQYLNDRSLIRGAEYLALCYSHTGPAILEFFNKPITFLDPCRGTVQTVTLKHLAEKTANRVITLLDIIEDTLLKKGDVVSVIDHPDRPEIRPCPAGKRNSFKYWYGLNHPDQMLFQSLQTNEGDTH